MKITNWKISPGPTLHFDKALPSKTKKIKQKPSLLLDLVYSEDATEYEVTSEIPLLDNYSLYDEAEIRECLHFNKTNDLFKQMDFENIDQAFTALQGFAGLKDFPAPLLCAIEANLYNLALLTESSKKETTKIKIRKLFDGESKPKDVSSNPFYKLKISPQSLYDDIKHIEGLVQLSKERLNLTLDANRTFSAQDWINFFDVWNNKLSVPPDQVIQYIEEPMPYAELKEQSNFAIFTKNNIPLAIDESLCEWLATGISSIEIKERLKLYPNLIFKPGMLSLTLLNTLDVASSKNIYLSCLYEGPWNIPYYFYLYTHLQLNKFPAGIEPLLNIKENQKVICADESEPTNLKIKFY